MKQIGEYIILQPNIAKGAFASIHKGEHKYTHLPVAIKEIKVPNVNNLKKYVMREIEIHKKLNHPNIVKIYDVIISQTDNAVYMFMEYCEYGDLQKYQKKQPFTEKYIQQYMLQLRDALKYLYDNNIVHRDLKPQNILLTDSLHIKITDFGLARNTNTNPNPNINYIIDNEHEHEYEGATPLTPKPTSAFEQDLFSTYCGSPIYMSPELLNKQNYNSKSDLWSVGIILYELITGTPPYIAKNIQQLITKVNCEPINLDKIDHNTLSPECFDLLKQLLNNDKHSRMDWNNFFTHKWFDISNNILINNDNLLLENPLEYDNINITKIPIFKDTHSNINKSATSNSSTEKLRFSDTLKINSLSSSNSRKDNQINNDETFSSSFPRTITTIIKKNNSNNNNNNSNKNYADYSRRSLKKQFTFNLRSSQFNEDIALKHRPEGHPDDINLSDLEQDDIPEYYTNTPTKSNSPLTIIDNTLSNTKTKPINIINNNRNNNHNNNFRKQEISSSNSSSLSNTPNQYFTSHNNGKPNKKSNDSSPSSIAHAINFIKETYDYLSNDNKSL